MMFPGLVGVNVVPLTPVPEYVPPAGEPPEIVIAAALEHIAVKLPSVAVGAALTICVVVVVEIHPAGFV